MFPEPTEENGYLVDHALLLLQSYERVLGQPLFASKSVATQRAKELFTWSCVVVSHDTAADPKFNYGNRQALLLFERDWPQFTALPSRYSAEPIGRDERQRLLDTVTRQGYIDDYQGVRISASGRRFHIPQATVWNVIDEGGNYRGQAATFCQWDFLPSAESA